MNGGDFLPRNRRFSIIVIIAILWALIIGASLFAVVWKLNEASEEVPIEERILTYGMSAPVTTLNPYQAFTDEDLFFQSLVYDPLISVDEEMKPKPNLAKSWWFMDGITAATLGQDFSHIGEYQNASNWPLGSIWEYNLTENVFWSDGHPFTADDVEWTINIQIGDNYDMYRAFQPYTRWIYMAEAVNDTKVRIFFHDYVNSTPIPVAFGDSIFIPIMPKHLFEDRPGSYLAYTSEDFPAVGTGPFIGTEDLEEAIIYREIVTLIQNPYYSFTDLETNAQMGLGAYFDRNISVGELRLKYYDNALLLEQDLRSGRIDAADISFEACEQWLDDEDTSPNLTPINICDPKGKSITFSIEIDLDSPGIRNPCRYDPAIWRATALSINKSAVIESIYHGLASPGIGMLSDAYDNWFWQPDDTLSSFEVEDPDGLTILDYSKPMSRVMEYDLGLANEILDAAGYEWGGEVGNSTRIAGTFAAERLSALYGIPAEEIVGRELAFELMYSSDPEIRDIFEIIKPILQKCGIEVDMMPLTGWTVLNWEYVNDIRMFDWTFDPDPSYILYPVTGMASNYPNGWNIFGTDNESYNEYYMNQISSMDYFERKNWVDACQEWQYLSGNIVTVAYPMACYAINNQTWDNWGNWSAHPRLAIDNYWGENPLWFNLIFNKSSKDGSLTDSLIISGVLIVIGIVSTVVLLRRYR